MKKLILFAALYCLQISLHAAPVPASERAKADFKNHFAWVQDASWSESANNDLYCVFHEGKSINRVFYDHKGYWLYTLVSYAGYNLPGDVKANVQNYFEGYQILYVNEIRSDETVPVYVINIENKSHIKVVRVTEGNIEIQQDIENSKPPNIFIQRSKSNKPHDSSRGFVNSLTWSVWKPTKRCSARTTRRRKSNTEIIKTNCRKLTNERKIRSCRILSKNISSKTKELFLTRRQH